VKLNTKTWQRAENGTLFCRVQIPFHISFEHVHFAASMVEGITRDHKSITAKQVSESLEHIIMSCGSQFDEICWDTPDAFGIKDETERNRLTNQALDLGYHVVVRLWPEMKSCPAAQKYAKDNEL
jgi:hypothetical protein